MESSPIDSSPVPLKFKLNQVKYLLDDANKKLQEKVYKYEIFTTKTSASSSPGTSTIDHNSKGNYNGELPSDIKRTINDISTLSSVLSCPIFDRIVNVTDSLDKLSYHLNLHPSIGPSDINIDDNGELILAPPIEPTALNNLINSKLDEYSDHSNISPQVSNPNYISDLQHQSQFQVSPVNNIQTIHQFVPSQNEQNIPNSANPIKNYKGQVEPSMIQNYSSSPAPNAIIASLNSYNSEKLMVNGSAKNGINGNGTRRHDNVLSSRDSNNVNSEPNRLYKANGHYTLNRVSDSECSKEFNRTQSIDQIENQPVATGVIDQQNEFNKIAQRTYFDSYESNQNESMAINQQQSIEPSEDRRVRNVQSITVNNNNSKDHSLGVEYNRGSCSPSTSVCSTARLADEYDSGASSFQSQNTRNNAYPPSCPNNQKTGERKLNCDCLRKQDFRAIEKMHNQFCEPEMEKIQVTLEKDANGLGITVAGYTCEREEISGIFVKNITPDGPAHRSGKIRTLDQIFEVDGLNLIGFSNVQAVGLLRDTGKVVNIVVARHLQESKYRKIEAALAHAIPFSNLNGTKMKKDRATDALDSGSESRSNIQISNPTDSRIPVSQLRSLNESPSKSSLNASPSQETHIETFKAMPIKRTGSQLEESIYRNTSVMQRTSVDAHNGSMTSSLSNTDDFNGLREQSRTGPQSVANENRGNKVIETKQGARNTIDIRSPASQQQTSVTTTATATYVNKLADSDYCESSKSSIAARLRREAPDEFGRLISIEKPEWENKAHIVELSKDHSQGLGFTVKEYANPKDPSQSIIMITSITPGGVADRNGELSFGDLLIFVDDTNLEGANLSDTVRALKKSAGRVRLGVLKLRRV